ncbi:hypothetical protein GCM10023095_32050 [Pseudaeromonas paramecii]|uniref:Uncharacterized protein n=1 Tax=Pseudaeromonas paramecii TaxID=2138166 RepID=A0ABP8QK16_9GAMM
MFQYAPGQQQGADEVEDVGVQGNGNALSHGEPMLDKDEGRILTPFARALTSAGMQKRGRRPAAVWTCLGWLGLSWHNVGPPALARFT